MKKLCALTILILLPMAANALTGDFTLSWPQVTQREDGSALNPSEITYTAYYAPLGSDAEWFELPPIPGTESSIKYPDLQLPDGATGIQFYMIATDSNGLKGRPSNIASKQDNVIDVPIPIDPTSPPGSITININGIFKGN